MHSLHLNIPFSSLCHMRVLLLQEFRKTSERGTSGRNRCVHRIGSLEKKMNRRVYGESCSNLMPSETCIIQHRQIISLSAQHGQLNHLPCLL